jgi:predicted nucleic acid-binding protein
VIRIYPDSSTVIYFVEGQLAVRAGVATAFRQAWQAGSRFVVSDLTHLECRVLPLRLNDTARLGLFDVFFSQTVVERYPLATPILERATEIRAYHGLRVPDAMHLATALEHRCDAFWTGDQKLARVASGFIQVSVF